MIAANDLTGLRSFASVADTRSFSRAAERLGVTASALSQTIIRLEDRVGVRLLNRTTRSVAPTDAGAALLARLGPALDEIGDALAAARDAGSRPAGTVRIHSFRIAAELFLDPMLAVFARAHPGIVLDLTIDDSVADLVAGGFDVGLRLGEVIDRDLVAIRLGGELRQVAVAAPGYLAERGTPEKPADLLVHDCLRWRWPGRVHPYDWEFCEAGRWFAVAVKGPLIADDRATCIRAAVNGAGIAFAAEQAVAPWIARGQLVPLLEPWSARFPGFHLCYPTKRRMAPALRAFVDAVRTAAR